jgi:hypothetical protein
LAPTHNRLSNPVSRPDLAEGGKRVRHTRLRSCVHVRVLWIRAGHGYRDVLTPSHREFTQRLLTPPPYYTHRSTGLGGVRHRTARRLPLPRRRLRRLRARQGACVQRLVHRLLHRATTAGRGAQRRRGRGPRQPLCSTQGGRGSRRQRAERESESESERERERERERGAALRQLLAITC